MKKLKNKNLEKGINNFSTEEDNFTEVKITYNNGKYSIPPDLEDCITLNISDVWGVEQNESKQ